MKHFRNLFLVVLMAVAFVGGPTGCGNLTLDPQGVYAGDKFLYGAEKTLNSAYRSFDKFTQWEEDYRAVLPVEVSHAADTIRKNGKRWIDSGHAFRDAYVANPTAENRDKLTLALNLIDTALAEAVKYQTKHKALKNK